MPPGEPPTIVRPGLRSPYFRSRFATRFWRSARHSVWFDEAVSLQWAAADPAYTWRVAFALIEEKHPPVYYLALHYWQQFLSLFGLAQNDAALRALGGILGALTVLGVMLLARRLSGRAVGLLAGALVALALLGALSLAAWRREGRAQWAFLMRQRRLILTTEALFLVALAAMALWWASFIVFLELALYSYLFSAFILPAAVPHGTGPVPPQRRSLRFFVEGDEGWRWLGYSSCPQLLTPGPSTPPRARLDKPSPACCPTQPA